MHVQHADGEAKFWIDPSVELHANYGLKPRQITEVQRMIEEHLHEIRSAWAKHFPVEVTNVSPHGFWLFAGQHELFVPFKDFPWFKDASIREIAHVTLPSPHHLYWPDLDIDLAVESLTHPERYPLVSQAQPKRRLRPTKAPRTRVAIRQPRKRLRG